MAKADWLNRKAALAATLVAALLVSCSSSKEADEPVPDENTKETEYLSLSIAVDAGDNTSRAGDNTKADDNTSRGGDPSGGSDGDGREEGFEWESKVNNATVFLVSTSDNNITSNLDPTEKGFDESSLQATIAETYYFSSFVKTDDKTYKSEEKQCELKLKNGAQYYVLVVVNMGDLSKLKGETLETLLKNSKFTRPCVYGNTPSEATNFSMASTAPVKLTEGIHTGSKSDPFVADVTVERLAARIDFDPTIGTAYPDNDSFKGYMYTVMNSSGTADSGCRFVLESVIPFNMPNGTMGENLFKIVSSNGSTPTAYVRQETYNSDDYYAEEYVLDRAEKSATLYDNYMSTSLTSLSTIVAGNKESYNVKATLDGENFYIVNYVMENVPIDNNLEYATGIILHGTLYEASECENGSPKADATGEERNYVYYIRHCNPNSKDEPDGKMYYGIVRNNIYRMTLKQISVLIVNINLKVIEWKEKRHSSIYI